jgi:tricorn protease
VPKAARPDCPEPGLTEAARGRTAGYLRQPTISGDRVVYLCEDDLWLVDATGGVGHRLTANLAEITAPVLSPDGERVAFTSREEHHPEVWLLDLSGGPARRLSWLGSEPTSTVGWTPDGRVAAVSSAGQPFARWTMPLAFDQDGGPPEPLPFGPCRAATWGPDGGVAICRHETDPARWKRYRGGTVGQLWVDRRGDGRFGRVLADLPGNLASPMWLGDRLYFVSDHEGVGNLYSCRPDGADLRRHTDHAEYYARFPSTDGQRIVYQHAAAVWLFDPAADETHPVPGEHRSPRVQRNRRFVSPGRYLQGYAVHPEGHSLLTEHRGQLFRFPLWEDGAVGVGPRDGVRHRLGRWLADGRSVLAVHDGGGEERLSVYDPAGTETRLADLDLGEPQELVTSPTERDIAALVNHRHELWLVDLAAGQGRRLDASQHGDLGDVSFSPDGRWLAYACALTDTTRALRLVDTGTGDVHTVTEPEFRDSCPVWDPAGGYLYFLSARIFDPVPDDLFFEFGFPRAAKPFALPLRPDIRSPFQPPPRPVAPPSTADPVARSGAPPTTDVDVADIARRAVPFPVPTGRYRGISAVPGKVLLLSADIHGALEDGALWDPPPPAHTLASFDLAEQRLETLVSDVVDFAVAADGGTLVYRSGERLRALPAGRKPPEVEPEQGDQPGRRTGWIDLDRVRVSVDPAAEWRQMFREAWRLQRDHFWTADLSGVDWERVYRRYQPLLDVVAARSEFADLMWEMQGELGTSHAYERGGDYRPAPEYAMGFLGADLEREPRTGRWRIARIPRGDGWQPSAGSPLQAPGVGAAEGDTILTVAGRPVDGSRSPQQELVHQAGMPVELTLGDARGRRPRTVVVTTLADERPLRYRDWVADRRRRVHEASDGRVGYLHIPDMMWVGYSEFHRSYLAEVSRDALLVDVRDNAGGEVSQLLLEKLARRRVGYDVSRYRPPAPYPAESPAGPLVCLTNANAGSDGDIFTHTFKLYGLGPVVGTRTWGGVIGIDLRHRLVDRGITTQPAMSFWFVDVGWGVENYGTDPDIELDITPAEWVAGRDPQLERGVALLMTALRRHRPQRPEQTRRPSLALPTLPPRPEPPPRRSRRR